MQFQTDNTKIKRWREERHWSQEHLADLAGIAVRTVQRIENGERASYESVMALAAAFNVDVAALSIDPVEQAKDAQRASASKSLNALRMSFYIHLASYVFGMIIFLAISLSANDDGFVMLIPAAWWTVGLAGHALAVVIVMIATHFDQRQASR